MSSFYKCVLYFYYSVLYKLLSDIKWREVIFFFKLLVPLPGFEMLGVVLLPPCGSFCYCRKFSDLQRLGTS